jgi:hypothetical protein
LEDIAYLDWRNEVEIIIKKLNLTGGYSMVGAGINTVNDHHAGYTVYIRDEINMKMCVFYLKHHESIPCAYCWCDYD